MSRIILDTDIGTNADDAVALALALKSPEIRIAGITTVYGKVRTRALIAQKVLDLCGVRHIPVCPGIELPLLRNRPLLRAGIEGKGMNVSSIPLYSLVNSLGWVDTYAGIIIPGIANGLVIFLFRQFFLELPTSLVESARMDGASWLRVYANIVMPLCKPVTVSASLLIFIQQWVMKISHGQPNIKTGPAVIALRPHLAVMGLHQLFHNR